MQKYLGQHRVGVYLPEISVIKRGRQCMEPLFPGYAFVWIDPFSDQWNLVRWARGLSYFLPSQSHPMPIADSVMEETQCRVAQWNAGGWVTAFGPGDRVYVEHGPLKTLDAIFQRYIPGKQRCEILVSLVGHLNSVQIDVTDLYSPVTRRRFAAL